jgi:anti-anti-sigma factor
MIGEQPGDGDLQTNRREPGGRPPQIRPAPPAAPPSLEQPFDDTSLYAMREAVEAHAARAGMPEDRIGDMAITLHELATNAVRHGGGAGVLRLWRLGEVLYCEVSDDGPDAPKIDPGAADSWIYEHGHGLWLARHMADDFSVRSGPDGTVAAATFHLPGPALAAAELTGRTDGDGVLIEVSGPLDKHTADRLAEAVAAFLADAPAPRLTLDLRRVVYWDSLGITGLVAAQQRFDTAGTATLTIAGVPGSFRRRLSALGFIRFTFAP